MALPCCTVAMRRSGPLRSARGFGLLSSVALRAAAFWACHLCWLIQPKADAFSTTDNWIGTHHPVIRFSSVALNHAGDTENRLIAVTNTATLTVTRFYYDGDGTRVKKVESKGGATITTAYAGPIEVTITGTQRITQAYYMAGAQRVATRVISSTGSVVYYLHADHLGSASLTTDGQGNKLGELRYSPYGVTRYVWGATPTDRRFTGQRSEEASLGSLYDYGARMYSPVLGQFLSADTMVPSAGNPQSLNRYAYVRNSPLKFVDPTGHYEFEEEPDDPVSFGTNVRSKHDYTHSNYRAGNQSDAQFLAGVIDRTILYQA